MASLLRSRIYRELAELPAYTSAFFLKSSPELTNIYTTFTVRDHVRNLRRTLAKFIVRKPDATVVLPPVDLSDTVVSVPSPSGQRRAVLRSTSDKKRFAEIWRGDRLEAVKDVTKDHDEFYTQPSFFSLCFSASESALLYCAERNVPDADSSSPSKPDKFRFLPDFGERFNGKRRPNLFILRWNTADFEDTPQSVPADDHVQLISLEPTVPHTGNNSPIAFGQAVFAPDGMSIYATGYDFTGDGRRLGIFGCWNRPTGIWRLDLPSPIQKQEYTENLHVAAERITSVDLSCRCPRITPVDREGRYQVVWLANPTGGAHASSTRVYIMKANSEPEVLVDYVWDPSEDGFPGVYAESPPYQPFIKGSQGLYLLVHSTWRSQVVLLAISLTTGHIENLTPNSKHAWTVHNADGELSILATRSALNEPEHLLLGTFADSDGQATVSWTAVDVPVLSTSVRTSLASLEITVIPVARRYPTEIVYLRTTPSSPDSPLITFVHGGPHTASTTGFDVANVAYALQGYNVALINYTGSLGFGQKHVDALLGRAGELDVQDCMEATKYLVENGYAAAGPGKQFVMGGSHGGFLGAHLIGQYPGFFSAAALRNPVTAAGECASSSDIPDWSHLEFGSPFVPTTTLTPSVFTKLQNASPIAHVDNISSPVLLLVGEGDRRVPPPQSVALFHALKGRGLEVDMLMFPNNGHALDGVEAQRVCWETTMELFEKFKK